MTPNTKVSLVIAAVVVAVVGAVVFFSQRGEETPAAQAGSGDSSPTAPPSVLVREDSHKLSTAADSKVTVVEFLDLECEACGAAFPGVEKLRAEYGHRVTFVMRYFPLPTHLNAELAATAVEAAGQQGRLEAMYQKMYETQPSWGDQQVSHRDTFLGFARELGLDMATFEAALDDPATLARVLKDRDDGLALGVQGTPTFFVNGVRHEGPPTYEGLKAVIEEELGK